MFYKLEFVCQNCGQKIVFKTKKVVDNCSCEKCGAGFVVKMNNDYDKQIFLGKVYEVYTISLQQILKMY